MPPIRGGTRQKFGWLEPRRANTKPQSHETSRDELFSSLKMARRAETRFPEYLEWRDEPRRALARARRAKNEPARPKISKKNETDEPALFDNV